MTRWIALTTLLLAVQAQAWECKFERELEQSLDVGGSESLSVIAAAGDLEITGVARGGEVAIRGSVCASKEEWLDQVGIAAEAGDRARIAVNIPEYDTNWSLLGNRYIYVDLVLEVPEDLPLSVRDSSGDIDIENVAAVSIRDSSGDIEIDGARGDVEIEDSSGDITVGGIAGDFTVISDSSGGIRGSDIDGNVLVQADSSGDIRFTGVGRDVMVERDSSGDISVASVGGDFSVLRDGSGDISATDVDGEVRIPDHKR